MSDTPGVKSNAISAEAVLNRRGRIVDTQPLGTNALLLDELTKPFHRKLSDDAQNLLWSNGYVGGTEVVAPRCATHPGISGYPRG